jgi:hypothetical protein
MRQILAKPNHCLFFSKVKSRFGLEREFLESQLAQCREIIAKPNNVLYFWKVKACLCLERERMYASCASGSRGYRAPVEKELVIF